MSTPTSARRVLVIDDQPDILHMVRFMLENAGFAVDCARSGRAGLEQARRQPPDLILCDIMMRGMTGYDVLQAVRRDPDLALVPFIFLTAKATFSDLRAGMELGADDYLTKPFTRAELLAAIETQLGKQARRRQHVEQRLAMLREGLSTVLPHELRTPLTLILANASMLLDLYDAFEKEEVLESLRAIHTSAERLHRLVENLLIYVQLQDDATLPLEHPHTPDAGALIAEAARERAHAYGREEDLDLTITTTALPVHPFHLRKLVAELTDNAFKFSPPGHPVRVQAAPGDDAFILQVEDQGRGMTAEQIRHTEAYVQFGRKTTEQQGGGLGLSIARHLATLYGGTLTLESTPGQGTRVVVRLPLTPPPA
ncbi:MAG: hybrid sensor histidine kinase/response regulator [Rhodothermaceae bacterium]|nr:MAG: hybrid sensor histidine kinase/response regulator [Rhodothermaceae bacterium]